MTLSGSPRSVGGTGSTDEAPPTGHRWTYIATRLVKDALLRIPGLARLDAARHARRTGRMEDPEWVAGLLVGHLRRLAARGGTVRGARLLELGPGRSLGQLFLVSLLGAEAAIAVDVRRYATATTGAGVYRAILDRLEGWVRDGRFPGPVDLDAAFARGLDLLPPGAEFPRLGKGIDYAILRGRTLPLPSASIDLAISCSVLEHVADPAGIYRELARVLRPGALMSHIIDLRDHHRPEPFDFLRYPDRLWSLMQGRSAGFTNRLRGSDHLRLIREAGFEVVDAERRLAEAAPPAETLAPRFRGLDPDDIRTLTLIVTARRP